ncbi:hypothetical protein BPT24_199 [Tenacibaculum phage pT24]|uniref:Uncharacterized protein n=1 Tax=Tenacibaculum phage pT24 TaxID=1880590 RepID=A0A1B4XWY7_9CAUD|nr:hypothetical protein HYP10_gp199 [Tenacibaculum phage pT24]BAV39323.1 hypothetical protein BPT24_199 [Tenacibaculum phage pT24]
MNNLKFKTPDKNNKTYTEALKTVFSELVDIDTKYVDIKPKKTLKIAYYMVISDIMVISLVNGCELLLSYGDDIVCIDDKTYYGCTGGDFELINLNPDFVKINSDFENGVIFKNK